ncbi:radical SAM protein [Leptospira interrogans]|nr:radical SAM protein [Leptospira interrogans]
MENYKKESDAIKILARIKGPVFEEYRKRWDLVNNFELETEFPMFLHIETSFKCNFRCPMCVQGVPELKEKFGYKEKMTTESITKILLEGKKYNTPSVSFQGDNEPFLNKEITDWFKLAIEFGYLDVMVNTNGSLVTEELAEKIIKSGLTRIRFSLDAINEDTYKKIRIGGKFEQVMKNIDNFLRIRKELNSELPIVGVIFVRMKENENEMNDFIKYWNEKVDFVVIQDFMTPDVEGDFESLAGKGKTNHYNFRCNQPWQRLYIRGNGDVTPCCAMFSSYLKLGDTTKLSLVDLWNSKEAKDLRKIHKEGRYHENPICLKCSKMSG